LSHRQFIRPRKKEENFSWDIVDHGISKEYLWKEYQKALREGFTPPCDTSRCRACGVCNEKK
ncbi:MAG: hypothetical protein OEM02_16540, partial [Desulfobulbaceae bacterium]|nr:hypothetical protein [Desulfobulbaceae bacterium]